MAKKNTITKTDVFAGPWRQDTVAEQYTDLEVFLNWVKKAIQGSDPTSDGVKLILQTTQSYDGDEYHLLLSWQEQENKTSKRVQKAISKIKRSKKGKKK